ncbi:aldo/keto reductase [Paenibacillus pasadenensis]|uniref:aldo/keto reductase n=1 Tax=Paenibacillus pasadenensis TaxID=217090 RepID=UPI0020423EB7|nr:aldo/keto reductase [Paenibacillus pasadenensis]MCM3747632.1 aldo/keto reductase [Paenibacillus pasadenensis]
MTIQLQGLKDTVELHNGVQMPRFGLGVWQVTEEGVVEQAVMSAIKAGYRSIDTAKIYGNEDGVGRGIRDSGISRDELFITTKVWNADMGYESTLQAFQASLDKLGLDKLDLYLIHWPVEGKIKDTWRAMEKLYKDGRVSAIGVCNFHIHHLKELMQDAEIKPMLNQVECHPLLSQAELREFCQQHGIVVEAWSPLMQGNLGLPELADLAKKHGKTPAQIVLRWDLQHGIVTIPKSTHEHRIIENAGVFDFELSAEDMALIDGINQNKRFGPDPDNFDF